MKIREAKLSDTQAISNLARSLSKKYVAPEFHAEARDAFLKSMTVDGIRQLIGSGLRYHLAEINGNIVGIIGMKDNVHLYHLFVDEYFHRKGIARLLWNTAMKSCKTAGNPGEFTVNSSRYAQRVYESFGFVAQSAPHERNGIVTIPMKLAIANTSTVESDNPKMAGRSMVLRLLKEDDITLIQHWPTYPPEFEELDYALRNNGWLTEYRNIPNTKIYIAEQAGETVAFSILSKTGGTEAEFRIALRADKLGHGLGKIITSMTLAKGFTEIALSRIHLIVRKNNSRAIRLYKRLGFNENGDCWKNINGKQVNFLVMEILRGSYYVTNTEVVALKNGIACNTLY